jgi:Ca2+-binding RTX toxin-like protein
VTAVILGIRALAYVDSGFHDFFRVPARFARRDIMPITIDPDLLDDYLKVYNPIIGTAASEALYGTAVRDRIDGKEGNDYLYGDDGGDWLIGGSGNDDLNGGYGHDQLEGGDSNDYLYGTYGRDTLLGGAGNDNLNGGGDNDSIEGGADNDYASGGDGNDFLKGDAGDDRLYGGNGDDRLQGGEGQDQLFGGEGHDSLTGSTGDVLKGGGGNDSFHQEDGSGLVVAYGEDGNDRFYMNGDLVVTKGAAGIDTYIIDEDWDGGVGIILDFDLEEDWIRIEEFTVNAISFFKDDNDNLAMKFDSGGELHFNNIDYAPGYLYSDFNIYEYFEPNA